MEPDGALHIPANGTRGADRPRVSRPSLARRQGRSIGSRLIASFASIVLLMIAADVAAVWAIRRIAAAAQRVAQVDEASLAAFRVHADLARLRDAMTEAASTADAGRFAGDVALIRRRFLEHVHEAERTLAASPDLQRDAEFSAALESLRATMMAQLDGTLQLASAGDWNAVRLRLASQLPVLVRFSSALVQRIDERVLQRRSEVIRAAREAQRRFLVGSIAAALMTLLAATALSWYVTRTITAPLHELTRGAEALARGDFRHRVALGGKDELAVLGGAFDDAAGRLQRLYEDLRRSERSLRDVVDTVPAHVWSASRDGTVDFVNERLRRFTGMSPDESSGWTWEQALHPDDRARFVEEWRAAVSDGRSMDAEVRVRRVDGVYSWLLVHAVPLRDEAGKVTRWYASGIEIEDRKRAEQERERLRELEMEIAHINRVSTLGELAASIAHEIRQPLAATVVNAGACLNWLERAPPDLDEVRRAAERIVADGQRAAQVIDRLRSLYRKASPRREPVPVNEVIREMTVMLRSEAHRHGVSIHTDLAAELPPIRADRVQLQQVLMNLIVNALEAMKDGGGALAVTSRLEDGRILVSLSDTGVGLPAGRTDQIFDAFFTTKPQGSGMGLAISRAIVESHGGRLWATPNEGRGATFHLTLPTAAEEPGRPASGA